MKIDVKLDKDFVETFENLKSEYGETLAKLNGFSDDQLNHTSFIDGFIDKSTVADASIDPSANVGRHDMPTLLGELPKSHKKLLSYSKLYYEIKKKWDKQTADNWITADYNGILYLHDAPSASFCSYCYKGTQQIIINYNQNILFETFEDLYDIIEDEEVIDASINYPVKFPTNLYVLDYDHNLNSTVWTKITRICKHANNLPMRFIKLANGLTQIVTANHPIITDSGDKPAAEVVKEDKIYSINYTDIIFDNSIQTIEIDKSYYPKKHTANWTRKLGLGQFNLTKDLGWLTGMLLSDASFGVSSINYSQRYDSKAYQRVLDICNANDIPYVVASDVSEGCAEIRFKINPYTKWLSEIQLGTNSLTRKLPADYIHYSYEFLDGFIAGMIDGDGSVFGEFGRQGDIFSISETLVRQCEAYLRFKGIFSSQVKPELRTKSSDTIKQAHPLFRIQFNLADNETYFKQINCLKFEARYVPRKRKKGNFKEKKYQYQYSWVNVLENRELLYEETTVYDITTETGHFICNNILSHNCFAYDLKDLAEKGLYFLDNGQFNAQPPQHLETFIDFVKEFISYTCNRTSGAVGLPNLIPYMYYFWKKDCESGYYIHDEEYYARQQIQRFIYGINQPYTRDGIQSAFTNTSIFDHPYFEAIFGGAEFPDGTFMIDYEEEILEFQKIFMEEMSEIRASNMMTFPVNSISLLFQNGEFVDEDYARWAIEHNRKWNDSNLFVDSTVNSLSNCCRLKSDITDLGYFKQTDEIESIALHEMYDRYLKGELDA